MTQNGISPMNQNIGGLNIRKTNWDANNNNKDS